MNIEGLKNSERRKLLKLAGAGVAAVLLPGYTNNVNIEGQSKQEPMHEGGMENKRDPFEGVSVERGSVDVGGGAKADFVKMWGKEATGKAAVVLSASFNVPLDAYKYVLRDFAKTGRTTYGINYPSGEYHVGPNPADKEFLAQFAKSSVQIRHALQFIHMLDTTQVEGAAVLGHSQGGAEAAIAAILMARRAERKEGVQRIRNLIFFESAGLIGKDNLPGMATRFARDPSTRGVKIPDSMKAIHVSPDDRAKEAEKGNVIPKYGEISGAGYDSVARSEIWKDQIERTKGGLLDTMKEVWGLSHIQIQSLFRELKKHRIGILVITAADSTVFPSGRVGKTISDLKESGENTRKDVPEDTEQWKNAWREDMENFTKNIVDGVLEFRGDHALREPQVPYIEGFLSALEKKQEREDAGAPPQSQ